MPRPLGDAGPDRRALAPRRLCQSGHERSPGRQRGDRSGHRGVWAEHAVWPQDPGFETALAGGVTTLQVLPGSANLIGDAA